MKTLKSEISLLAAYLNHYNPITLINNTKSPFFQTLQFARSGQTSYDYSNIYLIDADENQYFTIIQNPGNYITISSSVSTIKQALGAQSNIIILPPAVNVCALCQSIENFMEGIKRAKEIFPAFCLEMTSGNQLKAYLDIISDSLQNPVALWDQQLNIIGYSGPEHTDDSVWESILYDSPGSVSEDIYNWLYRDLPKLTERTKSPVFFENDSVKRRLLYTIQLEHHTTYIIEVLEYHNVLKESDRALLLIVTTFLQFQLLLQNFSSPKDDIASLFEAVISGEENRKNRILKKAVDLGISFAAENYMLMIFHESDEVLYDHGQFIKIMAVLRQILNCMLVMYEYKIILILSKDEYEKQRDTVLIPYLRKLKEKNLRCSLSFEFSSVCELKKVYEQCCAAAKLGIRIHSQNIILNYKIFFSLHFYSEVIQDFPYADFFQPVARQIIEYDQANKTQYFITLYYYLKNYKNVDMVADKLHCHRNTIFYRIQKAAELFYLDLNDNYAMNNLCLSFELALCSNLNLFQL